MASQNPVTGEPLYRKTIRDQKADQWLSSCPGPEGGKDWQAASYHQPTDTIILPLSQSCVMMLGNGSQTYFEMPGTERNMGRLSAYRTADHEAALDLPAALAVPDRRAVDRRQSGLCRRL